MPTDLAAGPAEAVFDWSDLGRVKVGTATRVRVL